MIDIPKINNNGWMNEEEVSRWYDTECFPILNEHIKPYGISVSNLRNKSFQNSSYCEPLYECTVSTDTMSYYTWISLPGDKVVSPDKLEQFDEIQSLIHDYKIVENDYILFYKKYGIKPHNKPDASLRRHGDDKTYFSYTPDMDGMTRMRVSIAEACNYMYRDEFTSDPRFPTYKEFIKRCIQHEDGRWSDVVVTPKTDITIVPFEQYVEKHASDGDNTKPVLLIREALLGKKRR